MFKSVLIIQQYKKIDKLFIKQTNFETKLYANSTIAYQQFLSFCPKIACQVYNYLQKIIIFYLDIQELLANQTRLFNNITLAI